MSQGTLTGSFHATDTSPLSANQDLEERQAPSQVAMISSESNHEVMLSQETPSVHTSPFVANQDLEERQAPSQAAMPSSNYAKIFYKVLSSVNHNPSHNRSGS